MTDAQNVSCTLDSEVGALYCNYTERPIKEGEVAKTVQRGNSFYDYDEDGNLLGIETLQNFSLSNLFQP